MKNGKLYLSHMGLPELLCLSDGIELLWCENNQLTELPPLPDGLDRLRCGGNPITYPPVDVISGGYQRYQRMDAYTSTNSNQISVKTIMGY